MPGLASRRNQSQSKSRPLQLDMCSRLPQLDTCSRLLPLHMCSQLTLNRKIADQIATAPESKTILIDSFAGAGGNVIQFALSGRWTQIFAVEKDPATLACAKHNAEIYGVSKKIFWIQDDAFRVLKERLKGAAKSAVVFASPPWGGRSSPSNHARSSVVLTAGR